jgi:poly(3-hydroxybutyrate) depolymerase
MYTTPISGLIANDLGAPQDLANASAVAVCANRSSFCNVMLDVPSECAGSSSLCPVLFCLHGFGGSNKKYVDRCGSQVHSRSFIGVYPQGDPLAKHNKGFGWNDGMAVNPKTTALQCAYDNFTCTLDPNDGLFFEAIVGALRTAGAAGNLYAFGQSNGADWVQRLGVNAGPSLPFVGIAPQSGQLNAKPPRSAAGVFNYNQPRPGRPRVAQLSIHGTADKTIPYDGGPKFHSPIFIMYSEPDSDKVWAEHNGCTGALVARNVSAKFKNSTGVATHHVYNGCPPTAPVEWYETHGAGHVGTSALGGAPVVEVVLKFFERVEKALLSSRR